jgi:hypothetical protein
MSKPDGDWARNIDDPNAAAYTRGFFLTTPVPLGCDLRKVVFPDEITQNPHFLNVITQEGRYALWLMLECFLVHSDFLEKQPDFYEDLKIQINRIIGILLGTDAEFLVVFWNELLNSHQSESAYDVFLEKYGLRAQALAILSVFGSIE